MNILSSSYLLEIPNIRGIGKYSSLKRNESGMKNKIFSLFLRTLVGGISLKKFQNLYWSVDEILHFGKFE